MMSGIHFVAAVASQVRSHHRA